jgi:hypothetical protein
MLQNHSVRTIPDGHGLGQVRTEFRSSVLFPVVVSKSTKVAPSPVGNISKSTAGEEDPGNDDVMMTEPVLVNPDVSLTSVVIRQLHLT